MVRANHPINVKRGEVCVVILGIGCQFVILIIHI